MASTVIDEWSSVKAPPPPELKPVQITPQTTALLMMDFMQKNCGQRPRCVATLEAVAKFLAQARANNLLVIYTAGPGGDVVRDTLPQVAPLGSEPMFATNADKFYKTDLEKILREKGIDTIIALGTAAHGAVLYTATGASIRGYKVIVPIDGMSSENAYAEQYTTWHLANAAGTAQRTTLTRFDMIRF